MQGEEKQKPRRRSLAGRIVNAVLAVLTFSLLVAAVALMLGVNAPDWMRQRLESRLNLTLNSGRIVLGNIRVTAFSTGINPEITLRNVRILNSDGRVRAALPEVVGDFALIDLLKGRLRPVRVVLNGAHLVLNRDENARFDISVGDDAAGTLLRENGSIAEIMQSFEDMLAEDSRARLQEIVSNNMRVDLHDALTGRDWRFYNGRLLFENAPGNLNGTVNFELDNPKGDPAEASFSLRKVKGEATTDFSVRFNGLRARDVADQVVAFGWLRILDAPIAGSMSMDIKPDGAFGEMHGVLDIGAGEILQTEQTEPVRFSGAKAYLSYDQAKEKFTFNQISVKTDETDIVLEGHAYLSDRVDRTVGGIIGQLKFTRFKANPQALFVKPLDFSLGALDVRVRLDPLKVDIGQMVLVDDEARYVVKGSMALDEAGWTNRLDLSIKSLSRDRLLEVWPLILQTNTRDWISDNVTSATLLNVAGALRSTPGKPPHLRVGFDLSALALRFLKTLPPIENGVGYGVIDDMRLDLVLQSGNLTAPDGDKVELDGTTFHIPDMSLKPATAEVHLKTRSPIKALLTVLDLPPFQFMTKARVGVDIAAGNVATDGSITLPLLKDVTFDQVALSINGRFSDVSTDKLVKGKVLRATMLNAYVDNQGLTISGDGHLGQVGISGVWQQQFGPDQRGKSKLDAKVEISSAFLKEFGIGLPESSVQGAGIGDVSIDLERDKPPEFHLVSDLNRLGLSLAAVGWSKPKNRTGKLEVRGTFGQPPEISALTIKVPGLAATGSVRLAADGKLALARFTGVNVNEWLKTPIDITLDADGQAVFTLNGGVIDFRNSRFGETTNAAGKGNRISARLDRLIVSDSIALTGVEGELVIQGGLTGSFSGRVNGNARIVGVLAPHAKGTAVRFTSTDAGAVMTSAGLFDNAIGGRLDMILVPTGEKGQFDGTLKVDNARIRNSTTLASILSAISVVGLLEQLGGEGILFNDTDAKFRLSPAGVVLNESSAVGASLGLTMEGVYNFNSATMDMQGVITPIYILNGILEQTKIFGGLFGKQKGEGLFGFNYSLRGKVDDPKVGVNPLSILTPGLFRDIFRRPMPKAPK
ncbi:MAG: hypothetical protein KDA67_03050 [Rhodobacteraceae bacterium]|nr:hypothetical protein [Paracoccaceae bacterium]